MKIFTRWQEDYLDNVYYFKGKFVTNSSKVTNHPCRMPTHVEEVITT